MQQLCNTFRLGCHFLLLFRVVGQVDCGHDTLGLGLLSTRITIINTNTNTICVSFVSHPPPLAGRRTQRTARICARAVCRQSRNIRSFPVSSSMFVRMPVLRDHHALLLSCPSLDAPSCSQSRRTWIRMVQLQVLPRVFWRMLLPTTRSNGRRNMSSALHVPRVLSLSGTRRQCLIHRSSRTLLLGFG